ncbi:MAG: fasciclin domain-containing protein [Anaerolineales bacterium]|nr:fasciclin domain-containing protein [Anaerolineales bacterium]
MLTRNRLIGFVLVAALLLAAAPAVFAAFSPEVFAINQPVIDNMVRVTRATTDGPGWLVIHADDGGKPGPIIGHAALPSGINANVYVTVDPAGVTDVLYAMLHTDADKVGEFEYPEGDDAPVMQGDKIVMQKFEVTGIETTVVNQIAQEEGLTTLVSAIEAAGLTDTLRKEAAVTIFAPSDAAFAALPKADLDALLADPAQLADVLAYHVLPVSLPAADLETGEQTSLQGSPLLIDVNNGAVTVNGAAVITPDVAAANGIVHIIDTVLMPPPPVTEDAEAAAPEVAPNLVDTAAAAGSFTTLLKAVEAAGLTDALAGADPLTVFAPSDDAFAALPKETLDALLADPEALAEVLKYHILPGTVMAADVVDGMSAASLSGQPLTFAAQNGGITVNGAKIVTPDVTAGNGVIHVIDQVLMPPAATPEATTVETATAAAPADTIAAVAAKSGQFKTLLAAAEAAGLADALNGSGPLTVFAPTDEAFAALPPDLLDALLKNPAALKDLLLYHVVLDKLPAADLPAAGIATNAQGNLLVFTTGDDKIFVNGAEILQPDIEAGNGLIHVIDEVLLPPPSTGEEAAVASPAPAPTDTPTPAPTNTPTPVPRRSRRPTRRRPADQ